MTTVRTPQQQRSIQTKARIMKAAFRLFAKKGIHGTNSKEIVRSAGVSIGSFYSYFKNKKALLLDMLDDYLDRHYSMIWKNLDRFSIEKLKLEDIKEILTAVFQAYDISPEFHRQTHALRYSDPDIHRIYDKEREREVSQVRYLLENNKSRLRVKDVTAASIIIHNSVENVAHTAKFIGSKKIDEDRLINELADMIYNFVVAE